KPDTRWRTVPSYRAVGSSQCVWRFERCCRCPSTTNRIGTGVEGYQRVAILRRTPAFLHTIHPSAVQTPPCTAFALQNKLGKYRERAVGIDATRPLSYRRPSPSRSVPDRLRPASD